MTVGCSGQNDELMGDSKGSGKGHSVGRDKSLVRWGFAKIFQWGGYLLKFLE